jgi:phosphoesterase RecJ-like protein
MTDPKKTIADVLREKDNFLVASHFNPDGDAIGSISALGHILAALGKNFTLYNPSGLPPQFDWLDLPAEINAELPNSHKHWLVALDCGDAGRMGKNLLGIWEQRHTINIDHHLGNSKFGELNWVDTSFSAVGEMIAELARELKIPLKGGLGESVYLAVVSDTGSFSYGNTRPETFRLAAEIIEQGLDLERFNHQYQNQWSFNRLQLWSAILGDTELHDGGRIGLIKITDDVLERTGTTVYDTDNLVNFVRKVKSVQVAVSLREENNGRTKFSLRSNGNVNVQELAAQFGGGGHRNASGGSIQAPMDKSARIIVEAARRALEA